MLNFIKNTASYLLIGVAIGIFIVKLALIPLSYNISKNIFNYQASKLEQELILIKNAEYKGVLVKINEGEYELKIISTIENDKDAQLHKKSILAKYVNLRDNNVEYSRERRVPEEIMNDIIIHKMAIALGI